MGYHEKSKILLVDSTTVPRRDAGNDTLLE